MPVVPVERMLSESGLEVGELADRAHDLDALARVRSSRPG
jgi:hypothetical protein